MKRMERRIHEFILRLLSRCANLEACEEKKNKSKQIGAKQLDWLFAPICFCDALLCSCFCSTFFCEELYELRIKGGQGEDECMSEGQD